MSSNYFYRQRFPPFFECIVGKGFLPKTGRNCQTGYLTYLRRVLKSSCNNRQLRTSQKYRLCPRLKKYSSWLIYVLLSIFNSLQDSKRTNMQLILTSIDWLILCRRCLCISIHIDVQTIFERKHTVNETTTMITCKVKLDIRPGSRFSH